MAFYGFRETRDEALETANSSSTTSVIQSVELFYFVAIAIRDGAQSGQVRHYDPQAETTICP